MLDIYPPSSAAQAMAIWGIGVMIGPDPGPDARRLPDRTATTGATCSTSTCRSASWPSSGCWLFMPTRAAAEPAALRLDRLRRAGDGHRRAAADARPRPGPGLVHLARDRHRGGAGRRSASTCSSVHLFTARAAVHPPAMFRDRNFIRRRCVMMFAVGTMLVCQLGADGAVAADPRQLPGRNRGAGAGAARHRHHRGDDSSPGGCSTRIDPRDPGRRPAVLVAGAGDDFAGRRTWPRRR